MRFLNYQSSFKILNGTLYFLFLSHNVDDDTAKKSNQGLPDTSYITDFVVSQDFEISIVFFRLLFTFASIVKGRLFASRFRDLNPFLRVATSWRPISQVDEPRERTRRHRISAEIAHQQIGWTIYSPVVAEFGKDVETPYRRRLSCGGRNRRIESPMSN